MALTLISVAVVSLLAFLGAIVVVVDERRLRGILRPVVGVAIGVLIGEACLHLIPDAIAQNHSYPLTFDWVVTGIVGFAALELVLHRWVLREGTVSPVGIVSAVAEGVHNAMDGALIASAYFLNVRAGLMATVAVCFHEIPHELGNVAVLLHAGYPPKRAVAINLASASAALLGAVAMIELGERVRGLADAAGPFAAGGFLYLALGILTPELWRTSTRSQLSVPSLGAACGFFFTGAVAWLR